jgi:A/G-specific adenine glycosylase
MLRALPGFGEYTAAAVASLAFGLPVAAADANVTRVLSRLFAIRGLSGTRVHGGAVRRHAEALLPRERPGDLTAALMDLGQLICTPRRPDCVVCPVSRFCAARAAGTPERFPQRRAKPAPRRVFVAAACAVSGQRALLVQRPGALLAGLWRFPFAEGRSAPGALRRLGRELDRMALSLDGRALLGVTQHTIVNRRLEIRVYRARRLPHPRPDLQNPKSIRWFSPGELERGAIPTLTRKIARAAGFLPSP